MSSHVAPRGAGRPHRDDRVVELHHRGRRLAVDVGSMRHGVIAARARLRSRTWSPSCPADRTPASAWRCRRRRRARAWGRRRARRRSRPRRRAGWSTGTSRRSCWSAAWSRACASALSGVTPSNWNSHSKSCRGRPVQAQIRCLTWTCSVVAALPSLKDGSSAGHRRLPGQLPLVHQLGEHQRGHRLGVRRDHEQRVARPPSRCRPARARRSRRRRRPCRPAPGRPRRRGRRCPSWPVSTNVPSSAMRASSSRWAFLPANDSRV